MAGKVYLMGAGPGDPELLTLKAFKLLKWADVVLHDDLVGAEILALVPSTAKVINVGKRCGSKRVTQNEIHALLVSYALLDLCVVRLKSGDPLIFGRAGEEMEALRKAGIEFEVVPGITAALGAAAAAQVPLTFRGVSSAVTLLTNHHTEDLVSEERGDGLTQDGTLVVYMPGTDHERTAEKLVKAGTPPETPCAIIARATSNEQQVYVTTIAGLPGAPQFPAPSLLIVGKVAQMAAAGITEPLAVRGPVADLPSRPDLPVDAPAFSQEFTE